MLYEGPFSTPFYRQLHTVLHKEFRSRRGLRQIGAALRRPGRLRPEHAREAAAILFRLATLPGARRRLNRLARAGSSGMGAPDHMPYEEAARPSTQPE
jgi:hypothetical protein